jgi:hypothetical protein
VTGKIDGSTKPRSSLVATAARGLSAYVNIDRGQGTYRPRRIQVDALRRMVTAARTRCYAERAARHEKEAVDLMDNAGALTTTPQSINQNHQALFEKKRPHVAVGPMKGGYHLTIPPPA